MGNIMGRILENSGHRLSFETVWITDLDFMDEGVIFMNTSDILAKALQSLSEEAEPLGLRVA